MRNLQITLFIIALAFATTQTFRHVCVKWLEPRTSVLDKYDDAIEKEISASESIDNLLSLYDEAQNQVKKYESDPDNPEVKENEKRYKEPYKTEIKLRDSIEEWESHKRDIHKLRFFWACGLLSVLIGFWAYIKIDQWLGIVGVITGFTEMIFWTCPRIFGFFGARYEFERLLNNKLFFSLVTCVLLIATWFLLYHFQGKRRKAV